MNQRRPGTDPALARARAQERTQPLRDASARLRASAERVRLARLRLDAMTGAGGRTPTPASPRVRALGDDLAKGAGLGPRADDDEATRERRRQNLRTLQTLVRDSLVRSGTPLPETLRVLDEPPLETGAVDDAAPDRPDDDRRDDDRGRNRGHLLG